MWMHRDLHMLKVLQSTISYAEFIGITKNKKSNKAVRYSHVNKLWERCYVLLRIIILCQRVIHLSDSRNSGMGKVYYYSRMNNHCIKKTIYNIDYNKLFTFISSPANIWNMSDDESDEE